MRVMMVCAVAVAWVAMVIDARAATLVAKSFGQGSNWSLYIDTEGTVFGSIQVDVRQESDSAP